METHRLTSHDGTQITWFEAGNPAGPTMVLANGLGGNLHTWQPVIDQFGDRFRIINWDYRGLFRSGFAAGSAAYSIPHHAEDLAVLLRAAHVTDPILVGWSMGVQVILEFHRRYPTAAAGFIALNGTPGRPFMTAFNTTALEFRYERVFGGVKAHWTKVLRFKRVLTRDIMIRTFVRGLKVAGIAAASLDKKAFKRLALDFADLDVGVYADIFVHLGKHDAEDLLPSITTPTLVITGSHDRFTPPERSELMVRKMRDAELYVVPRSTHFTPVEFPELVNYRMERFFAERGLFSARERPRLVSVAG